MATLYNHKEIETDDKPLIKNLQFKQLCARLEAGETEVYEQAFKHFSFVPFQITLLRQIFQTVKNKKDGNRSAHDNQHS